MSADASSQSSSMVAQFEMAAPDWAPLAVAARNWGDLTLKLAQRAQANPEELGAACAFLCSAHAGYITGQSLLIDGGTFNGAF